MFERPAVLPIKVIYVWNLGFRGLIKSGFVIPAQAGIQEIQESPGKSTSWTPAYAGVTDLISVSLENSPSCQRRLSHLEP
jgi:hypothetical protein